MSKSVKFRRDSPSGGSHYSDHQRSDSGVGSFSGDEARPGRPFVDLYEPPTVFALEEARQSAEKWQREAARLQGLLDEARLDVDTTHKENKEMEAHMRALKNSVENLQQQNEALVKRNKELLEKVAKFEEDNNKEKRSSRRKSNSPQMSGALPAESSDEKKPRRSASKKRSKESDSSRNQEKERERLEREYQQELEREKEKENERLRRRFESSRADESDAKSSSTSSKSHRSRRDSYIEPMGHSAPRPQVVQVPPSPSARQPFPAYTTSQQAYSSQTYQSIREPSSGARSVHPSVIVPNYEAYDDEDGGYHGHLYPLPATTRPRGRDR